MPITTTPKVLKSLLAMLRSAAFRAASRLGSRPRACLSDVRRFHSLGVSDALVDRLRAMGITAPSAAQKKAIPLVLAGADDVVIAAETGGGKTLAYLVPALERLRRHPLPMDQIHLPVVLLLTSSQELVGQIMSVLRALDADAARHAAALSSANQSLPRRVCPLLVATPKSLLRATKPKDFAYTQLIVVDEADMLLGGGFERDTKQILATIRNQPLKKAELNQLALNQEQDGELRPHDIADDTRQTVFSAVCAVEYATIPDYGKRSVREFIQYKFPNVKFAVTDDFHRTIPRLDIALHRVEDQPHSRMELLSEILDSNRPDGNTLVFTNSIESADAVHDYLATTPKINALLYHKEVSRDERQQILRKLQDKDANLVVVCTDIAARGLDTTTVSHVVQYEFANDVVSYIHRIGRTARAGTSGKVSSIVSEENSLVLSKIQEAGDNVLNGAFSRKRSLRKKVKKFRREARSFDSMS